MFKENLIKRIIFIFIGVPIVIFVIFFPIRFNLLVFIFLLSLITLSSYEYYFCLKLKNLNFNFIIFLIQSIIISSLFFIFSNFLISLEIFIFLILSLILISSFFYIFNKNIITNSLTLFMHILGLLYIPISTSTILLFYSKFKNAPNLLLFFLIIVWSSNIFGYLFGMFWLPRKPLNLEVSPNKSGKGFLGAIIFGTLIPFILIYLFPSFFDFNLKNKLVILLLIFLTNIFSIIGDLFESAFKRFCQVKDSSNYLKGFGGILDTIDSILFAFPFYFSFLLLLFK